MYEVTLMDEAGNEVAMPIPHELRSKSEQRMCDWACREAVTRYGDRGWKVLVILT